MQKMKHSEGLKGILPDKEGIYLVTFRGGKRPVLGWACDGRWDQLYWGEPHHYRREPVVEKVLMGPLTARDIYDLAALRELALSLLGAVEDLHERVTEEHAQDHADGYTDEPERKCLNCKVYGEYERLLMKAQKRLAP